MSCMARVSFLIFKPWLGYWPAMERGKKASLRTRLMEAKAFVMVMGDGRVASRPCDPENMYVCGSSAETHSTGMMSLGCLSPGRLVSCIGHGQTLVTCGILAPDCFKNPEATRELVGNC
jgi:hypothetical protein